MSVKRSCHSSRLQGVPYLRLTLCGCMVAATLSLFTPYPARMIEAWRGTAARADDGGGKAADPAQATPPPDSDAPAAGSRPPDTTTPAPVVSPSDSPGSHFVDARTIKPWRVEDVLVTPSVEYPPFPPVLPTRPTTGAVWNVSELSRGLNLKTQVNFRKGGLASSDRTVLSNYRTTLTMEVAMPRPLTTTAELARLNPSIRKMLPGLDDLFQEAKVSPYYNQIYVRKQVEIRKNLAALNKILDRHNFYDTETILEMRHPRTGRKVLWLQSEMDVVSDGSDGDRLSTMPDKILNSNYYQPSTSYRWKKLTGRKNPLLPIWESRLKKARADLTKAKDNEQRRAANNRIDYAQRVIVELKNYSFLIAEYDPFIVVPLGVVNQRTPFSPGFGDYAVVVVGDRLYPAIVGDAGPRYKTGEASLRMAKTINPRSGIYSRPVSDLVVSYVIFPGSANEVAGPPDYDKWTRICTDLLNDIGGIGDGYALHKWEDLLKPATTPPSPAPPPAPASPVPQQEATATPQL